MKHTLLFRGEKTASILSAGILKVQLCHLRPVLEGTLSLAVVPHCLSILNQWQQLIECSYKNVNWGETIDVI